MVKITEDPEILKLLDKNNLETSGSDELDFPEIPLWDLRVALEIAYQKGYAQGIEDHLRNGQ